MTAVNSRNKQKPELSIFETFVSFLRPGTNFLVQSYQNDRLAEFYKISKNERKQIFDFFADT